MLLAFRARPSLGFRPCLLFLLFSQWNAGIEATLTLPPDAPDSNTCSRYFGRPLLTERCMAALEKIPRGALRSIFTTRQSTTTNNYIEVPLPYFDDDHNPSCKITINLEGRSENDVFVLVPFDAVRQMAKFLIDTCVTPRQVGGRITFGLVDTLRGLIFPRAYDGSPVSIPVPAQVLQPNGAVDGIVAIPDGPPPPYNIPYYMTIRVEGPVVGDTRDVSDIRICTRLLEDLQTVYQKLSSRPDMQNRIARVMTQLRNWKSAMQSYEADYIRWWEQALGPDTPVPSNVRYECDATLGNPSTANCEAVLYQFIQSGSVILDPQAGPIIKTSGDCAIAIGASAKHATTWDMLRSVAETIVAQCVSGPLSGKNGGTATSQAAHGRRRRQTAQYPFPPTFEIAVYSQSPFSGAPNTTCAWGVVSSHQGDIRQCPAEPPPDRPPERMLGSNATASSNLTARPTATTPSAISFALMEDALRCASTGLAQSC